MKARRSNSCKMKIWNDFCDENTIYMDNTCDKIDPLSDIDNTISNNSKFKDLSLLWKEFVEFRINFIENELFETFLSYNKQQNKQNKDDSSLLTLHKKFKFKRNENGSLPNVYDYIDSSHYEYKKIIKQLLTIKDNNSDSVLNDGLKYLFIYNGISAIFCNGYGSDSFQFKVAKSFPYPKNRLFPVVSEYLKEEIMQFNYVPWKNNRELIKTREKFLQNIFKNDEFNKLIDYCINDINIRLTDYYSDKWEHGSVKKYGRFRFYIINKLSFIMFKELFINSSRQLEYPNLKVLFEIMYNFSIFIACYPEQRSRDDESFMISQFGLLSNKNVLFSIAQVDYYNKLTDFNYYYNLDNGGTLLHGATYPNMKYYVSFLLNYGFDYDCPSKHYNSRFSNDKTPYEMAVKQNHQVILSKFNALKNENDEKNVCFVFCVLIVVTGRN